MNTSPCFLITYFLSIFIVNTYSQENHPYNYYLLTSKYSLHSVTDYNLKNFPFQFGFEYETAIKIKNKNYFNYGFWLYANVNLYHKRLFIKAEYGSLKMNEELNGNAPYLFLGFSGIPFSYKQHNISISLGASMYAFIKFGIFSYSGSISYFYRINRYFSVIGGIKLPAIQESRYNEYFHNPMFTVGIQLF